MSETVLKTFSEAEETYTESYGLNGCIKNFKKRIDEKFVDNEELLVKWTSKLAFVKSAMKSDDLEKN